MSSNTSPQENKFLPRLRAFRAALLSLPLLLTGLYAADPQPPRPANRLLPDYFARQVVEIESRPLAAPASAEEWNTTSTRMRRQLAEMLGLDPLPARTPLNVVKTGEVKGDGFIVEKMHYQ